MSISDGYKLLKLSKLNGSKRNGQKIGLKKLDHKRNGKSSNRPTSATADVLNESAENEMAEHDGWLWFGHWNLFKGNSAKKIPFYNRHVHRKRKKFQWHD